MKKIFMCAAVLSLAMFAATAQANLLDDGSFELATDGGQVSNSAWSIAGPAGSAIFSASPWAAKDGTTGVWFQSFNSLDGTLSQSVVAPKSGNYDLFFWAAREPNHLTTSSPATLSSSGTGGSTSVDLFTATFNDALNMGDGGGTKFSLSLAGVTAGDILTVSVSTIGALSNPGASESLMVDNFFLQVPEPASFGLAGLGLIGLLGLRRKR